MADLRAIATDVYGRPLAEFIAARNEQASEAGDKELGRQIRALRKPSAAAWAVNALARERPEIIQDILDLGEDLRDAQAEADGARTRLLDRERRELTATALAEASTLATAVGGTLSAQAAAGVEETLLAAMTDPDAGDAVQDGLLVTSFVASPFEPVDLTDVLAVPPDGSRVRPARRTRRPPTPPPVKLDDKRIQKAERAVEAAGKEAVAAAAQADSLAAERDALHTEIADLRKQAARIDKQIIDSERALKTAQAHADNAERASTSAQKALDKAEARLEQLR
ncbi:hypothetical protein [Aeromicrobium sp.]|uniref:hypothetical protein n=1 Tax=Aeromicrobium sp. TaxID=1871063 RepID=UPI0030BA6F67